MVGKRSTGRQLSFVKNTDLVCLLPVGIKLFSQKHGYAVSVVEMQDGLLPEIRTSLKFEVFKCFFSQSFP